MVGIITFCLFDHPRLSYYGERCCEYLFGKKGMLPYKILFIAVIVIGPVLSLDLVWTIANTLNALMAVPNLIAVLLLSGVIARETKLLPQKPSTRSIRPRSRWWTSNITQQKPPASQAAFLRISGGQAGISSENVMV